MKTIRYKCWIEEEGVKFYGPGPNELLRRIEKEGSLSKAAAQMNMSYKKGWDLVQRLNLHSKEPLVLLKKGGEHGGGAEVTSYGMKFMKAYENLEQQMRKLVDQQNQLLKL